MAFPAEFKFADEAEFTAKFLVPLLQRMGFPLVVNYHGKAEFGKDLIVSEIDRFGHFRYHGLQAKYEPSISLNAVEDLIRDAQQAFNNPFKHPQTGTQEFISSFYAVNGGSLGDEAQAHYFSSLRKHFGDNVRLLQGKDLVMLDGWVAVSRAADIGALLAGMSLEIRYNSRMVKFLRPLVLEKRGTVDRLRTAAFTNYLTRPTLQGQIPTAEVEKYLNFALGANRAMEIMIEPITVGAMGDNARTLAINCLDGLEQSEIIMEGLVLVASQRLGPLSQQ